MAIPVLGTAHLFALVPPAESERLVRTALDAGFTAIDTAPSYGYGRSEECVGRVLRTFRGDMDVTSKIGILAAPEPARSIRVAKSLARRLPAVAQRRLRGGDPQQRPAEQGHFAFGEVRESVDRSLRRLHHIDRLLLHEVRVEDLTDELLGQLERYRVAGDVDEIGVATSNAQTEACVAYAPHLLSAVNISVAPSADAVSLPATVTRRVGHGVLGAGGHDLNDVRQLLRGDPDRAARWQAATVGTKWSDESGLADAMLTRAATVSRLDGVIVATTRADRLQRLHTTITENRPLPPSIADLLNELCDDLAVS